MSEILDPEDYLRLHSPPTNFEEAQAKINEFIKLWSDKDKKIALVTSGGTTVPLENNTVRFIDNFSAENDYCVIFMHRQFSLQPYSRHFSHSTNCFLDYLNFNNEYGSIEADSRYDSEMKEVLIKYQKTKKEGTLLSITFVTVTDYLYLLTFVSKALDKLKERALFYLAAAVSDFFIHPKAMSEHKIQSNSGDLQILMSKVPKFLKPLVHQWAPKAYIVSFKLETDPELLIPKARQSLKQYGHQLVIANLLNTRKKEVWFVYPTESDGYKHIYLESENPALGEIEMVFLPILVETHDKYIKGLSLK
ncbi:putative phosphopantothenoylcysteine synthetase [Neoconidiobolus thromboides FSU 785]|nr:putative phosphopantothenoylcysteine synthetase [Neoconidiobolus thromboides FSU 785]